MFSNVVGRASLTLILFRVISLITSVSIIIDCSRRGNGRELLECLLKGFLVYLVFVDIDALRKGAFEGSGESGYLCGNKFNVTYANIYTVFIYYSLHPDLNGKFKLRYILLCGLALLLAYVTECSTSLLAIIVLVVLSLLIHEKMKRILYNPLVLLSFSFFCTIALFFLSEWFLNLEYVKYVFHDILGESENLTGRLNIYEAVLPLLAVCPLYGFGLGNVGGIVYALTNCYDVQNGFFQLYLETGLIGTILYVSITIFLLQNIIKNHNSYPILLYSYTMILISTVEIPFGITFLIVLSLGLLNTKVKNEETI